MLLLLQNFDLTANGEAEAKHNLKTNKMQGHTAAIPSQKSTELT
jgi:hypothetical protein